MGGNCAKRQGMPPRGLTGARLMAMVPYTADHVRGLMSPQARAMAGGPPPPKPERPPFRPAGEFRPAGAPPRPAPAPQPGPPGPQPAAPGPPGQPPTGEGQRGESRAPGRAPPPSKDRGP